MIEVSEHAARRWQERKGSKASMHDNKMRIAELVAQARRLGPDKYYARGWIFVVSGNTVITVFRPQARHWKAIADAQHNPRLAEEMLMAKTITQ